MAIRKINGRYYMYFRDGSGKIRSRALKTQDEAVAKILEAEAMAQIRAWRVRARMMTEIPRLIAPAQIPVSSQDIPQIQQPKRMKIADIRGRIEDIRGEIPRHLRNALDRLARWCDSVNIMYCDELTETKAYDYLERSYSSGKGRNYKAYNNNRGMLSRAFQQILVPAGMCCNPFRQIPMRKVENVVGHKAVSDAEFARVWKAAKKENWQYRVMIALGFFAGCDFSTASSLPWSAVDMDKRIINFKRPKSGTRFIVGIQDELYEILRDIPCDTDKVCGKVNYLTYNRWIARIFAAASVEAQEGEVLTHHSLRASFFTRCDSARLDRRTTNLAGGHKADNMTDIYSHDVSAALEVCSLPRVGIDI